MQKRPFSEISKEEPKIVAVQAVSLTGSFRSKRDLYGFFTVKRQLFLPPYKETGVGKRDLLSLILTIFLDFLRAILNGTKRALSNEEVREFKVPYYEEVSLSRFLNLTFCQLSVKVMWPKVPPSLFLPIL